MSDRRFELVTTVAACVYRHTACSLAHGKKLAELIGESEVLAVVTSEAGREPEKTSFAASNYYVSQLRDFIVGCA